MAKIYKWRATTRFQSDTPLSNGVTPNDKENWQSEEIGGEDSGTWQYWYRDANVMTGTTFSDANSSRVVVSLTERWTTSVDARNNLTVHIWTTINSVIRDDIRGENTDTPGRNILIYREQGGSAILNLTDTQVATAHTIYSGPLVLSEYTFTLAPGENLERSSLYLHNYSIGFPSYDDIWFGVSFQNPLPRDYRPGTTLDTNTNIWKSHNRANGACHILSNTTNMTWLECRTQGGAEGEKGNPPLILTAANANSWRNQQLLGKQ